MSCGFRGVYREGGGQSEAWDEDCHGERFVCWTVDIACFLFVMFVCSIDFMFDKYVHCIACSKGSAFWMTLRQFGSMEEAIFVLRDQEGCLIYASDLNPNSMDVRDLNWDVDVDHDGLEDDDNASSSNNNNNLKEHNKGQSA